jgi:hypothetical protein
MVFFIGGDAAELTLLPLSLPLPACGLRLLADTSIEEAGAVIARPLPPVLLFYPVFFFVRSSASKETM